jgi:hypothetical protein
MIMLIKVSEHEDIRERNSERNLMRGRGRNVAITKWEKLYIEEIYTSIIKILTRVSPYSSSYTDTQTSVVKYGSET